MERLGIRQKQRKFGEIPDWAREGPVSSKNYDLRAEWHGATLRKWHDQWPFLSRDPNRRGTAMFTLWDEYFRRHLETMPKTYSFFFGGAFEYLNVPEADPQSFDPTFEPAEHYWQVLQYPPQRHEQPISNADMVEQFKQLLGDMLSKRLTRDSGAQGLSPAGTVFSNFEEAIRRHKRPIGQFEELINGRIEYRKIRSYSPSDFKKTSDDLKTKHELTDAEWDAIPNQPDTSQCWKRRGSA